MRKLVKACSNLFNGLFFNAGQVLQTTITLFPRRPKALNLFVGDTWKFTGRL